MNQIKEHTEIPNFMLTNEQKYEALKYRKKTYILEKNKLVEYMIDGVGEIWYDGVMTRKVLLRRYEYGYFGEDEDYRIHELELKVNDLKKVFLTKKDYNDYIEYHKKKEESKVVYKIEVSFYNYEENYDEYYLSPRTYVYYSKHNNFIINDEIMIDLERAVVRSVEKTTIGYLRERYPFEIKELK